MNIKAIETVYKGYRFRSRLEARWAVFFDALGIEWEYEKEGYDLGEFGWYLPDFEIKLSNGDEWFVEVKGNMDDESGIRKVRCLDSSCAQLRKIGVMLMTKFEHARYYCDKDGPDFNKAWIDMIRFGVDFETYNKAVDKAKQARFEHGETP